MKSCLSLLSQAVRQKLVNIPSKLPFSTKFFEDAFSEWKIIVGSKTVGSFATDKMRN